MPVSVIRRFLKFESLSGLLLFTAAILALILANSPINPLYQRLTTPLLFWINEGLMTLFFLTISLELKREFLEGQLMGISKIALPGIAALGGMLVPACIYALINYHHPETIKGWAIPVATDIAFALGILSLFGKRVPLGLKLFLMALAIIDDLGAIIIIAIFYTNDLSYLALLGASLLLCTLGYLNYYQIRSLPIYLLIGAALWICILKSGLNPTLAGVLFGLMMPTQKKEKELLSPARHLEDKLHPWVACFVMPLFAFVNSDVSFAGLEKGIWLDSIFLGTVFGLFLGKQLGVFTFSWIAISLGFAKRPDNTSWYEMYGVALLCGIGFTMSLFLGTLAFERENAIYLTEVRLGVLIGSTLSGVVGAMILHRAFRNKKRRHELETT